MFRRLCKAIGRPELADDPRFADHRARGERQAELDALIADWTRTRTVAEVEAAMLAAAVPAGRLYGARDMLADPHFLARGALARVEHPLWPDLVMQAPAPKLSESPSAIRSPAPRTVGEHNAEILGGRLGLASEALERLRRRGVV